MTRVRLMVPVLLPVVVAGVVSVRLVRVVVVVVVGGVAITLKWIHKIFILHKGNRLYLH